MLLWNQYVNPSAHDRIFLTLLSCSVDIHSKLRGEYLLYVFVCRRGILVSPSFSVSTCVKQRLTEVL